MSNMYSDDEYYDDEYWLRPHWGPAMDRMEYSVPEPVKKFQYFQDQGFKEGNVYEINNLTQEQLPLSTKWFQDLSLARG